MKIDIEGAEVEVDIVSVSGEQVTLEKSGRLFKGLSPFVKEKTPSFFVNPEKGTWHCFSSNQGGDAVKFIELTMGLSFCDAIEYLRRKD